MTELSDRNKFSLDVSEIWKFAAAIGISCAISLFGQWIAGASQFTTEIQVNKLIEAKYAIVQNEMKHYDETIKELKKVVENNNLVLTDIKVELAALRRERDLKSVLNDK